jgi:hypothetical protein
MSGPNERREVFLTDNIDENNVQCLLRPAKVCLPQQYQDAAKGMAAAATAARRARSEAEAEAGGLTLIHVSAQPEPFWSLKPPLQ